MIPTKPPPSLKDPKAFSSDFADCIRQCLVKNPEERPSATSLLQHKFIKTAKSVTVLKELVQRAMQIVEEEDDGSVSGWGGVGLAVSRSSRRWRVHGIESGVCLCVCVLG